MGDIRRKVTPLNPKGQKKKKRKRPKPPVDLNKAQEKQLEILLKTDLIDMLKPLVKSGRWLIAMYHCNGKETRFRWKSKDFPTSDLDMAVDLLDKHLRKEKERLREELELT